MESVGKGLATLSLCLKANGINFGLYLETININFNVKASSSHEKNGEAKLQIASSNPSAEVGGSISKKNSFASGNTVTIIYKNPLFSSKDELISIKKPEDIEKLRNIILYGQTKKERSSGLQNMPNVNCDLGISKTKPKTKANTNVKAKKTASNL